MENTGPDDCVENNGSKINYEELAQKEEEEEAPEEASVDPYLLIGMEGVCGTIAMIFLGFPLLQFVFPGDDGPNKNCLEDTSDTISKFMSSPRVQVLTAVYIIAILVLNIASVLCTKAISAVVL